MSKPSIRLIATDLDGTLFNAEHKVPAENMRALVRAIDAGVHVVVATGRAISTVPQEVRGIEGLKYLICANGASIYDNITEELLNHKCLDSEAIESIWDLMENPAVMKEVFYDGQPYTSRSAYDDLERFGVPDGFIRYVRETRIPTDDLCAFTKEHIEEVENINFNYANHNIKDFLIERLRKDDGRLYTLTASLPFNIEIGGIGVDKGFAVAYIADLLGISSSECMCIGDNSNDIPMIKWAGTGVAVADAVEDAQNAADYVTGVSAEGGVAQAIERYCF